LLACACYNAGMSIEKSIQSLGGSARAKSLSPEERSEIARNAALARHEKDQSPGRPLKATHVGVLKIGDAEIDCAVLQDGTRVLSRASFVKAIGRTGKVKGGESYEPESKLPIFLGAENLKPFVEKHLTDNSNPIIFRHPLTKGISYGYRADMLPAVCNIFLDAQDAEKLRENQMHIAKKCQILIRGLAVVGITALVDEATGYQEIREREALQTIIQQYISGKLLEWTKTFPIEFYKEICRLKGWPWNNGKMPQVVGKYTTDLVYERLAPGVLAELEKNNPVTEKGYRAYKHHQWLTKDVGHPALSRRLYELIGMARASESWEKFYRLVDRTFPRVNTTMALPGIND